MKEVKEMRVPPIKNGTVIDHITAGRAPKVLRILGITDEFSDVVSVAMNVPSKLLGKKDIVKVENRILESSEVHKIALIAPQATINIIKDCKVVKKEKVTIPSIIEGVIKCPNPNCISNTKEPLVPKFLVEDDGLRCYYCERMIGKEEVDEYII